MNFQAFYAALKADQLERCYLFEGEEEYSKEAALRDLEKKVLDGPFAEMTRTVLSDPDAGAIIAANETLPFMAERRLVIVRESGMLSGKASGYDEGDSAEKLKQYLPDCPPSSVLVFYVRGKADGRKKLYTALKKQAAIVSFERLTEDQLRAWIARECKRRGKNISYDTCALLVFSVGTDLQLLSGELEKLCAYAGEHQEITSADVDAVCARNTEYKVFDMAGAILDGDGKRAFALMNAILRDGEDRLYLLALLGRQCRQLASVSRMNLAGASQQQIERATGMPGFAVRRTLKQAGRYTQEQLTAMADACLQMEYQVKSGQIGDEGSLERLMLEILSYGR